MLGFHVGGLEVAEAISFYEDATEVVNMAFANEISDFLNERNVNATCVIDYANYDKRVPLGHYPSIGISDTFVTDETALPLLLPVLGFEESMIESAAGSVNV